MGRIGGNPGNKGGGRKTKREEIQAAVEAITAEALAKLARSKVKKYLDKDLNFQQTKELALPIALKDMAQKFGGDKDNPVEVLVKFINGNEDNRNSG